GRRAFKNYTCAAEKLNLHRPGFQMQPAGRKDGPYFGPVLLPDYAGAARQRRNAICFERQFLVCVCNESLIVPGSKRMNSQPQHPREGAAEAADKRCFPGETARPFEPLQECSK